MLHYLKWIHIYGFSINSNIIGYVTLVQLMGNLVKVRHAVMIFCVWIFCHKQQERSSIDQISFGYDLCRF